MLTPISTKIEEFNKKYDIYKMEDTTGTVTKVIFSVETFLRTALEQRDNEWRELIEQQKVTYFLDAQAFIKKDDIITKSKEI